ncbi:MAG: polysaccharide deacetylase family protein [Anaerolineae bacterium]|nr:polysaccharide deacetylase family protein [Anaerolineae bacterium]
MKHVISIDVEDWHQCMVPDYRTWPDYEDRIVYSTQKVLRLLQETNTKATFFVLGYVAEHHPELVAQIKEEGHEVASHGQHHEFVYNMTPDDFRADLERSTDALEAVTGEKPRGYRAPFFSIVKKNWWAFDILSEMGFDYDSSIYPVFNHRYGVPDAPREPHQIEAGGGHLTELPVATLPLGVNLPVGGGVYFRAMPYAAIKHAIGRLDRSGYSAVLYVHPWEMDPEQPVLQGLPRLFKARRYLNLDKTEAKWRSLLTDFSFGPAGEVFREQIWGETYG